MVRIKDGTMESGTNVLGSSSPVLHQSRPLWADDGFKVEHWSELAACHGMFKTFTKTHPEQAAALGITRERDLLKYNKSKFATAIQICKSCPVLEECTRDADKIGRTDDTVLAGSMPLGFGNGKGRPGALPNGERRSNPFVERDITCARGHQRWKARHVRGKPTYFCYACERERAKAKYHGQAYPTLTEISTCPQGHDKNVVGMTPDGRCKRCRREADARRRATGTSVLPDTM